MKRIILCGLAVLLLSGCRANNITQGSTAAVNIETNGDARENLKDTKSEMFSEAEVVEELTDRQFDASSVTTEYTEDGEYTGMEFIHENSLERHPQYDLYYKSGSGVNWTIRLIGNSVMAIPSSYNTEEANKPIIFCETSDGVPGYDGAINKLYTMPEENYQRIAIIEKVEQIDAATLDEYTKEVLGKLEQRR